MSVIIPKDPFLTRASEYKIAKSQYYHMVEMKECKYCETNLRFKLLQSNEVTPFSNSNVRIDEVTGDIFLSYGADKYLFNTKIFVSFFYASSHCAFIPLKTIPMELEVCGSERVIIQDQSVMSVSFEWRTDANSFISNLTSFFSVSATSKCAINDYSLVSNLDPSLVSDDY